MRPDPITFHVDVGLRAQLLGVFEHLSGKYVHVHSRQQIAQTGVDRNPLSVRNGNRSLQVLTCDADAPADDIAIQTADIR